MSIPLAPRGQCTQCVNGECAAFVVADIDPVQQSTRPRSIPVSAHETCSPCRHPWLSHRGAPMDPNDRNFLMRRGGCARTGCAVFFSTARIWDFHSVCICTAGWPAHDPPAATGVAPTPASTVQPTMPTSAPARSLLGTLEPPMHGFLGLPLPVQGNAATRRGASAARSIAHGPFAAATANHSGPRRRYPSANTALTVKVYVLVWPNNRPGDYDPPGVSVLKITLRNANGKRYAQAFQDHGLYFAIDIPHDGPTNVAEFNRHIVDKLAEHNLTMPACPDDTLDGVSSDDLAGQLWELLQPRGLQDVYTYQIHPSINDDNFGHSTFKKLQKLPNPLDTNQLWIFLAPRFGPLLGPVASFSTRDAGNHPCFGLRFLDTLPATHRSTRNDPLDVGCYGSCPSDETVVSIIPYLPPPPPPPLRTATPPPQGVIRHRSPTSQSISSDRRVRARHDESIPLALEQDWPSTPPAPPVRPPLVPLELGRDVLAARDINNWAENIEELLQPLDPHNTLRPVYIRGDTVRAIAACLIDLLVYLQLSKDNPAIPFVMEDPGLAAEIGHRTLVVSLSSFFLSVRLYEITTRKDQGRTSGGPGPERAVLCDACTVLADRHNFWQSVPSSTMFRPVLSPVGIPVPLRVNTFRAHGAFLAIHCFALHHGPHPISLWVIQALINGPSAMLIPENLFLHMDPGAYDLLAPWYDFHQDTPVPSAQDPAHPLRMFIFDYLPTMQPNLISNTRTKQEHDAWIIAAFAAILLGHPDPWNHPEWLALVEGFNIIINRMRFADTLRSCGARRFTVAIYDRRVKQVEDVCKHLRFETVSRASDSTTPLFIKLFEIRLQRYLQGCGHPPQLRGVEVSEEDFNEHRSNPLLRANLILRSTSDSDMCPTRDNWIILFRFHGRDTPNSVLGAPIAFHSCSYSLDIHLDRALQEILLEAPSADPHIASSFDAWVHSQFMNNEHNTG
ncbi:hypothetical protein DFH07DRAFT_951468 [Mycena maculata]|uniref:Uncharacterized protein n=1 Tax=Mycena maculata TaxID=230809 RepID=A0AAD7NVI3_9AGAR|nr:hypothetical protein DFH07DRAFT_951468 [Mycena maculata]